MEVRVLDREILWLSTLEDPCRHPAAGLTEIPRAGADRSHRGMKGHHQVRIGDQDRKLLLPGYLFKPRPGMAERRLLQDKDGVSIVGPEGLQRGHGRVCVLDGPQDERDAGRTSRLIKVLHLGLVRWKARIEQ